MKKLLLLCMLCYAGTTFGQIPYKTKEQRLSERSKEVNDHTKDFYLRKAGTLGVVANSLVLSSVSVFILTANSTIKKKNVNDDSIYFICGGIALTGFVCQISAWNCVNKAGKTTNTIGLTVSPAGASIAVTF